MWFEIYPHWVTFLVKFQGIEVSSSTDNEFFQGIFQYLCQNTKKFIMVFQNFKVNFYLQSLTMADVTFF